MSTASTAVVKKPSVEDHLSSKCIDAKARSTNFIAICLWGIAAIVSAANTEVSPNATGISVSIKAQDVLLMLSMTYLLGKGLRDGNHILVLPWIVASIWNMYHVHYGSLLRMGTVLKQTRTISKLPWIALTIDLLGLVVRLLLTCRVAHVAITQWCNKQLENHLRKIPKRKP
nr:uncharacterized protein LOC111418365 [Onthophagus taurus]